MGQNENERGKSERDKMSVGRNDRVSKDKKAEEVAALYILHAMIQIYTNLFE